MKNITRFAISFLALLLFSFYPASAVHAVELSDSASITLLTVGPGEELYSAFGHNGIRVHDYIGNWDVVFNYGTFDDRQPGFYLNFVKGQMIYCVSYENYQDFLQEYIDDKRKVTEQVLLLSTDEKKQIFQLLYTNAKPENRNYAYDFFWDNCATRPRNVFEKVLGNRLQYHNENCGFEKDKTMHDMLRIYVHDRPWIDFGFDLILGLPCEVAATPRNQTFLPDYLFKLFACATVDGKPFVVKEATILDYPPPVIKTPVTPLDVTSVIMIIGLLLIFFERRRETHFYRFDFVVFLIAGFFGVLFICLWIFTTHYSLPKNLNMLWLIPSHLIVAFFLLRKNKPNWLKYYFLLTYILMMVLLIGWKWNPQPLNTAFFPLIVLLAARSFTIFNFERSKK